MGEFSEEHIEVGKVYLATSTGDCCYFARYSSPEPTFVKVFSYSDKLTFEPINQGNLLKVVCSKEDKPVSSISLKNLKKHDYKGNITSMVYL